MTASETSCELYIIVDANHSENEENGPLALFLFLFPLLPIITRLVLPAARPQRCLYPRYTKFCAALKKKISSPVCVRGLGSGVEEGYSTTQHLARS